MKKKMFVSFMVMALVCALVGGATFAYFTGSASNTGNNFAAGTVDIASAITTAWTADCTNMFPGASKEAVITVSNTGSLDALFDVRYEATGALFTDQDAGTDNFSAVVTFQYWNGTAWVAFTPGTTNDFRVNASPSATTQQIKVIVTLPTDAGDVYEGDTGTVNVYFDAVNVVP